MIKLTINGKEYAFESEITILEACKQIGIDIPTLCHLEDLPADGACRLCTVSIEHRGRKKLNISCAVPIAEGMVVETHSPEVLEARRFILDLLLSNHVFDCFRCASNGDCRLQDYAMEMGIERSSYIRGKKVQPDQDATNPFFEYNPDRCIMCRRCARVCAEKQGRNVISVTGRGFDTKMTPAFLKPWEDSNCESCGNCVSVCPTGALSSKDKRKSYREWEVDKKVLTTCPHCGTGCQFYLVVKKNRIVSVEPANGPANKNILCVKGKFGSYKFVHSSDRLTQPLIKKYGEFVEATWEEAFDYIEEKFKTIQKLYGHDAIAGFSCSRAPNEDSYLFQKMMRAAFKTNNVDNCARVCHSASVTGLAITLGSGAMTNPIADITTDVEVILLVGSNPTEAHPVVGSQIRKAVRNGAKLIVVDPRKIDLVDMAHMHLQIKPGTNVAFANGLVHIMIENGWIDEAFIQERTEGFEDLKRIVKDYTAEKVAEVCNLKAEDLIETARLYAQAGKAPIIYCLGVTEHTSGTEGVMSLSNIAMAAGKLGKPGCGINPLRGQNNVQGACDMGALPTDYPGYQKVNDPVVQAKFEKAWGVDLPAEVGLRSTQALDAAVEGKVKGMILFGENIVTSDPNTNHVIEALESLDCLICVELFMTETAELADVVLPGMSYAEKEGTFTNTERRVQRVRKAVEIEGPRLDTDIFAEIMRRMGYPQEDLTASELFDEMASLTPSFAGISFDRLDAGESLQWPCTGPDHPGTPILHVGNFTRGLGYFYPTEYRPSAELPDKDYPLMLVTGRMLYHYNTGMMTHRTEGLMEIAGRSYIQINEEDAHVLGIRHGDKVQVTSRRGQIETQAWVTDKVNFGETFMPFHFPDGNPNAVTNNATDPLAFIPEFKVCAIKIEKIADSETGKLEGLREAALL